MSVLDVIRGRQVVIPLTNKSGAERDEGDVVVVDTSTDDAFTTTTSTGNTCVLGVVQETIANDAEGRVLVAGYAATVEVDGATTRGQFLKTGTTAGLATPTATFDAGVFAKALSAVGAAGQVSAVLFGTSTEGGGGVGNDKARAHLGSPQTIGTGAFAKINLDTEDYDPGSNFDSTVNYRFDVPTTGYYLVIGGVHFASSAVGERIVAIYVDGVEETRGDRWGAHGIDGARAADIRYWTSGSFVELWCYQDSGGNLNTENPPFLAIHRLS